MDKEKKETKKSTSASPKVKATRALMATRFICLPKGLLTLEQFRALKAGEAVEVSKFDPKLMKEA